jgi:hypothetical protein
VGFNLVKAVSRAVGLPDKIGKPLVSVLAPALLVTDIAVKGIETLAHSVTASHAPLAQQPNQGAQYFNFPSQEQSQAPNYYVAPSGFSDYQPSLSTAPPDFSADFGGFDQGGPAPWDYSIASSVMSAPPSIPRYQTYSAPTQGSFLTSLEGFLPLAAEFL